MNSARHRKRARRLAFKREWARRFARLKAAPVEPALPAGGLDMMIRCGMGYVLDCANNVIAAPTLHQWNEWATAGRAANRHIVNQTEVAGLFVSTVFLGCAMNRHREGEAPLVFETMVFDQRHDDATRAMQRYATWDEAAAGHAEAVEWAMVPDA